jgi:hypothetical protein
MNRPKSGPITITREQLYEQVWKTPLCHLASKFGLSDVGLAKLCVRRDVPRPARGYWSKLEHGKPVTKPQLPSIGKEQELVRIENRGADRSRRERKPTEAAPHAAATPALVPSDLSHPHSLVESTRKKLVKGKANERALLESRGPRITDPARNNSHVY